MWTSTSLRLSLLSLRLETRRRRRGSSSNPPAATRGRRRRLLLQEVTVQVALRPAQPARLGGRCCRGRPGTRGSSAPPRLAPPPVTNSPGASRACRQRPSCTGCRRRTASTSCCGPRWATFAAGGRTRGVPPALSSRASTDTGWRRTQSSTASPPRKKDYSTGPPLGATGSRGGSCGLDKSLSVPAPCGPCQCSAAGAPAPRCPRGAGCQPEDDAGCQPEDAVRSGVGRTLSMSVGVVLVHHLRELV